MSFVEKTNLKDLLARFLSQVAVTNLLKRKRAFGHLNEIPTHGTSLKNGIICQDIGHTTGLLFRLDLFFFKGYVL